jgi:uroporphyrinogen-III synthase
MAKYKVLSTKKLKSSLVAKARKNDVEIIEQEFISVTPILSEEKRDEVITWVMSNNVHHVVFTSANAVEAVKNYLPEGDKRFMFNWNIFCISGRTKSALKPYVCDERILATADYGKDLAQKIIERGVKEIVFFCGNRRRDELPAILNDAGIKVHEVTVYETVETPAVAINEVNGILFFSPSAVQSFFSANQLKTDTVCFAIGTTTAEAIKEFTANKIIISEATSQESILASVQLYFENSNRYE